MGPRAKKIGPHEAAVVVRERDGRKVTSIGVRYAHTANLAAYTSSQCEVSLWVDVEGEPDDHALDAVSDEYQAVVRRHVEHEIEQDRAAFAEQREQEPAGSKRTVASPRARTEPKVEAPKPKTDPPKADHHGPIPPPANPLPTDAGRPRTTAIMLNGRPRMTAGIDAETLVELFEWCPKFEEVTGLDVKAEMANFIKDPAVLTRQHLRLDESRRFLQHLKDAVAAAQSQGK